MSENLHQKSMLKLIYIGNDLQGRGSLPTGVTTLSADFRKAGFEVETASGRKNRVLRLLEMLQLVLRKAGKYDLVLIDTYSTSNFWYAYFTSQLCRKLSLKYIPILHGGGLPWRLKNSPKACRAIFENAYINITPSRYLLEEFKKAGFFNLEYIPNTIRIKKYPFKERKVLRPKLLWVRAFAGLYNPMLALKVLEQLLEKYPYAELCMVGPQKDASREQCEHYAEKKRLPVVFKGKMEKQDWIQLSSGYDIFLNTTTIDNTPLSVIEAMALGLPVISTKVGGMTFLIKDEEEGLLVPPEDPREMARAVVELLQNPLKAQQLAMAARKKVEGFDWEVVKEKWLEVLNTTTRI